MTIPDSPYEAPRTNDAPPAKASRGLWILRGCATLLVLGLLMTGSCFLFWRHEADVSERELGPVVDRYLTQVRAGDYHSAYADFGQALRENLKEDDYVGLEVGIHQRVGRLNSKTLESWAGGADTSGRWARLAYRCEFEKSPGTLALQLRTESGQWRIIGMRYGSPLIEEALRSALTSPDGGS